ncbi:MAG: hypothetical protein KJO21_05470 [Verrucomicrobiae bacterium]|nr:hypothetical protein [Verrucomicrobiae bacterium]NNJ43171.1 hypothetical protein [Akkermansiaceae bacterium]
MNNTLVYLHSHASDSLRKLANHEHVIRFINQLEANPQTVGDYRQPDPRGRMIEVKLLGRQAVLFFSDPYANIVKVLDIRHVEAR